MGLAFIIFGGNMNKKIIGTICFWLCFAVMVASIYCIGYMTGVKDERIRSYEVRLEMMGWNNE